MNEVEQAISFNLGGEECIIIISWVEMKELQFGEKEKSRR